MRRFVARNRKSLAAASLGILQLAAYIVADPSKVPPWVVGLAVAINAFGVWAAPANARPVTRADLKREVDYPAPTRFRGRDDDLPRGGYSSGSRPASEMPPPTTGVKKPPPTTGY